MILVYEYELDPISRTAKIISIRSNVESIVIQRSIDFQSHSYLITEIWSKSLLDTTIKSVSFVDNSAVTTIEKHTFHFSSISSLSLPTSLENLEEDWCKEVNEISDIKISPHNKKFTFSDKMNLGKSDTSKDSYDVLIFVCCDATDINVSSSIKCIADS